VLAEWPQTAHPPQSVLAYAHPRLGSPMIPRFPGVDSKKEPASAQCCGPSSIFGEFLRYRDSKERIRTEANPASCSQEFIFLRITDYKKMAREDSTPARDLHLITEYEIVKSCLTVRDKLLQVAIWKLSL
jgi:hypothetical protein